jgi:hypothetical protein
VKWETSVTEHDPGTGEMIFEEIIINEGWYHHTTPDGFLMAVEDDDGKMNFIATKDMTFITPPNADMDTVCDFCGREMAYGSYGVELLTGAYNCERPTCPGKNTEDQNENG